MNLEKETFLRVLKGAPLSVLLALWVHGAMGRSEISRKTGWKGDTVKDALVFLEGLDLVVRPHYRKWSVSDGFHQLPLPSLDAETRKNRTSAVCTKKAETRKSRTSASAKGAETRKSRTSAPTSDLIRSDDDEEEDVSNDLTPFFPLSLNLLESIGLGGGDLERMAQHRPYEILGAWWYLLAGAWAKNPKAVLRTHLLQGKRTPRGFLDLGQWWLESPQLHEDLKTAVFEGGHVEGLSPAGVKAAGELWDQQQAFGL